MSSSTTPAQGQPGAYWQHEWPEVEALWRVNVLAPVRLCRDVLPGMRERGQGHIVNVSSLAGSGAFPGLTDYSATKAALNMFTAGMRADLRGLPIGTTLVEIGPVPTPLLREAKRYAPADHSFGRFYKTRLLVDTEPQLVAQQIVMAVQRGRRHVRLPRRAASLALLAEAPRRMTELVLTGMAHRA